VEQQAVPIAGQKENTSCYRKEEVYFWRVIFVLRACIVDIKNNSEIQLQFQIFFFVCFYKFGEKFLEFVPGSEVLSYGYKNLHRPFYISP
jgi:hypothetical protein